MPRNPFPGLRPFRPEEREFYFGRERMAQDFENFARTQALTVFYGRSGTGKSSFLTCRIMPEAQKESAVVYVNEWGQEAPEQTIARRIDDLLSQKSEMHNDRPLLILDQFEDVFKFDFDLERTWLFLSEVIYDTRGALNIVASMREEWLGAFDAGREYIPDFFDGALRLAPMSRKEYRQAIEGPIRREGNVSIGEGVVDTFLRDLETRSVYGYGSSFVELGLLQITASKLWREAEAQSREITADLYEELGGASLIVGNYVWEKLEHVSDADKLFEKRERMIWVAFTRHLMVAQGVKSILTSTSLSRQLTISDFGASGETAISDLGRKTIKYVSKPPETRGEPPERLVHKIGHVLEKANRFGFLKKQRGYGSTNGKHREPYFELSHDGLAPLFTLFAIEYDKWLNRRKAILAGALIGTFIVLPYSIYGLLTLTLEQLLTFILIGVITLVAYLGIVWIFFLIFRKIANFVITVLAGGKVPRPAREVFLSRRHQIPSKLFDA